MLKTKEDELHLSCLGVTQGPEYYAFLLYWGWGQCECCRIISLKPFFEFWCSLWHLSLGVISFNYHFLLELLQVSPSFAVQQRKSQGGGYTVHLKTGMHLLERALRKPDETSASCPAWVSLSWSFVEGWSARLVSPWFNIVLYRQIFYPHPLFLIFHFLIFHHCPAIWRSCIQGKSYYISSRLVLI